MAALLPTLKPHLLAIIFLVVHVVNSIDSEPCSESDRFFRGVRYRYICDRKLEYPEAKEHCASIGGQLPVVMDFATQDFLNRWTKYHRHTQIWLGLKRTGPRRNNFNWENGQPLSYSNWSPGEPNDQDLYTGSGDGDGKKQWVEGCTEMYVNDPEEPHGSWNDVPCSYDAKNIICQDGTCYFLDVAARPPEKKPAGKAFSDAASSHAARFKLILTIGVAVMLPFML